MGTRLKKLIKFSFYRIIIEYFIIIILASIFGFNLLILPNDLDWLGIILCFIVFTFIIKFICLLMQQTSIIKKLNLLECKEIEKQLKKPICFSKWNYVLINDYLINIRRFEVIKYEDVIFMYKGLTYNPSSLSHIEKHLYIYTSNGKKHKFLISYPVYTIPFRFINNNIYSDFSSIIKQKNPNVLVGKTNDNIQLIKEKYNIEL